MKVWTLKQGFQNLVSVDEKLFFNSKQPQESATNVEYTKENIRNSKPRPIVKNAYSNEISNASFVKLILILNARKANAVVF